MPQRGKNVRPKEMRLLKSLVTRVAIDGVVCMRIIGKVIHELLDGGQIKAALSAVYGAVFGTDQIRQARWHR